MGLLGVLGLPWPFLIFWPITDNQSLALGEQFSLPVCLDEAGLSSLAEHSVCGWLSWAWQQIPESGLLLLAAGYSSVTQSHSSAPSQLAVSPLPVSSLRLARRSVGVVLPARLWGQGLNTRHSGGPTWPGDPWLGDSHCLIDGVLRWTETASVSWEEMGEGVLEGRGRAAPLGAQAASWGDARLPRLSRLSVLWVLAGVVSTLIKAPAQRQKSLSVDVRPWQQDRTAVVYDTFLILSEATIGGIEPSWKVVNSSCNAHLREIWPVPIPPGWPARLKTGYHPFPDEASRAVQCGHQNRKQSDSEAVGIIHGLNHSSSITKELSFTAGQHEKMNLQTGFAGRKTGWRSACIVFKKNSNHTKEN